MWERLRRFSALERPAQKLFLRALVLLPLVTLSLRWRGFRATQAALQRFLIEASQESATGPADKNASVTAHIVNAADRHGLVHPSCLAKSLTLWCLSDGKGFPHTCGLASGKKMKSLRRMPGWSATERHSTNRTSTIIITPRLTRRSLRCHRKSDDRVLANR